MKPVERTMEWQRELLDNPQDWDGLNEDEFLTLCVLSLIDYGVTHESGLVSGLLPLFTRLADTYERSTRLLVMAEIKPLLDQRELHAMALLPLVICDEDQGIVSTATLDLLAYSELMRPECLPYGLMELLPLTQNRVPRNLGAVLGGLVVYGDTRLRKSMDTVALHCDDGDFATAARCGSGFVTHAAMDFWLAACERLQREGHHGDESRFGRAASALVNLYRGNRQPFIFDIERCNPAPAFDEPIRLIQRWDVDEYAEMIAPRLQQLADGESGEKIIPYVMREWGL